jgi:hypothetical protein
MKTITKISVAAALAVGAFTAVPALAADATVPCSAVTYNVEFLKAYPYAPAACKKVVVKNGVRLLEFKARVTDVKKDAVRVEFLNVAGTPIDTRTGKKDLTFTAKEGANLSVDGKKIKVGQLKTGDALDFWVPEGKLGLNSDPDSMEMSPIQLN